MWPAFNIEQKTCTAHANNIGHKAPFIEQYLLHAALFDGTLAGFKTLGTCGTAVRQL